MTDLRTYLNEIDNAIFRPDQPIAVQQEITALQHVMAAKNTNPAIFVRQPKLPDGTISEIPVLTNLFASRKLSAKSLGIEDHRNSAKAMAELTSRAIDPVTVNPGSAPVREVVDEGDTANLQALPALRQHEGDSGHYITCGHVVTFDPDSGIDNMGIQRLWVRGKRLMGCYMLETSHNMINLRKFWEKGEACPVAIWIGHHPAIEMGAQSKLRYPESHWGVAGGAVGKPLRLVPSVTHGEKIMVPADAEIVVEGNLPPNRIEAEGPFAEFSGYQGPQIPNPVIEVTCITRRKDAIYHDCGSGLPDHLVPDNMGMEGYVYSLARQVSPSLINVHVPVSGRRFHAYLQFENPRPGEVRDAMMAAIAFRRLKAVFAFDEDIEIFDDRQIMWALATRVQWHRDVMKINGLTLAPLDPSAPSSVNTITKAAIDATLPAATRPGYPKPVAPRNRVSDEALAAARSVLKGIDMSDWPN
ncbi:MAG: Phenolic acid decarboxylase subunit C [Alphaproteobacteria bacterium MarineAlpha11_Bin1]|mgnify:CR=1 FL=1|nr:MAG: Phenolic acid decarboxylase subunit C [Alphaproteobacteria bacterium MarineAlpha11_Bin1]|tara:strand:+ start:2438 stop:3850 length:1413 start_codon:yes stop_codon:yes gene_type:complete